MYDLKFTAEWVTFSFDWVPEKPTQNQSEALSQWETCSWIMQNASNWMQPLWRHARWQGAYSKRCQFPNGHVGDSTFAGMRKPKMSVCVVLTASVALRCIHRTRVVRALGQIVYKMAFFVFLVMVYQSVQICTPHGEGSKFDPRPHYNIAFDLNNQQKQL